MFYGKLIILCILNMDIWNLVEGILNENLRYELKLVANETNSFNLNELLVKN
jgi:hypothetical protein